MKAIRNIAKMAAYKAKNPYAIAIAIIGGLIGIGYIGIRKLQETKVTIEYIKEYAKANAPENAVNLGLVKYGKKLAIVFLDENNQIVLNDAGEAYGRILVRPVYTEEVTRMFGTSDACIITDIKH